MKKKKKNDSDEGKEKFKTVMKCQKIPLKNIAKDDTIMQKINEAVERTNKIVVQTYNFIKLYFLYCVEKDKKLPDLTSNFIETCMKIVSTKEDGRGKPPNEKTIELMKKLESFYDKYYLETLPKNYEKISSSKINIILKYEAEDMLKNFHNNVKFNFIDKLNTLVNVKFKLKDKLDECKTKEDKSKVRNEFRLIKLDLINSIKEDYKYQSNKKYHKWINENYKKIMPNKKEYDKDNIYYDVKKNVNDYQVPMININKLLYETDKDIKLFNAVPLRTDIKPKYITLDTSCLINLLIEENSIEYLKNVKKYKKEIWDKYFKMDHKVFKRKNYDFDYLIKTDGLASSIILVNNVKIENNIDDKKVDYIDDLKKTKLNTLKNKKIVGIDPGKNTLMYCTDGDNYLKYTQYQRRFEIKSKKYNKIINKDKKETTFKDKKKNKSIIELETELSSYNHKICNFEEFKKYLVQKNKLNEQLFDYYKKELYRKLKWYRFINTQRTEDNFINRFNDKFGDNKNVVIGIGDFQEKTFMKYKEPTKTKGFRKMFMKHGYEIYLVDEFRTSCRCHNCFSECEKFKKKTKIKDEKETSYLAHGILRCKNVNYCKNSNVKDKNLLWMRDKNGCQNIRMLADYAIKNKPRPKEFQREKYY